MKGKEFFLIEMCQMFFFSNYWQTGVCVDPWTMWIFSLWRVLLPSNKRFFVVAGYFIIFLNVCPLLKAKIFKENDWKHLASASSQMAYFE